MASEERKERQGKKTGHNVSIDSRQRNMNNSIRKGIRKKMELE
jgi:hypothetical protein